MSGHTGGAYPCLTWHTQLLMMLGNTKDEERALMDGGSCCQKETAKSLGLATLELSKLC